MNLKMCCSLVFLVFASNVILYAQNARFSQIGTISNQLNPSLTGRFDGKARMSNLLGWYTSDNPKNGYAETQHQAVSFDMKFGKYRTNGDDASTNNNKSAATNKEGAKDETLKNKKQNGYWGVGVNYYHYGASKSPIEASFISLSVARHFYNKSNKFYGFGAQVTNATGKLDRSKGSQYDREISGGGFPNRPEIYEKDSLLKSKKTYTDVNIGAYYGMNTEPIMFELGLSFHHIFHPDFDLYNDIDHSYLRYRLAAYSNLRLKLNNKWGLVQKNVYWKEGLYYRSRSDEITDSVEFDAPFVAFWAGIEFYKINPKSNISLNFGFNSRSFRTLMPYLNLNIGKYIDLRYSYEMPINSRNFRAYSAKRNEIGLVLSYGRNTSRGTNFYKKVNFW
jgi:hypothetical protein